MRGIDTNIVVRFIVGDDPAQTARARHTIEQGDIFVSLTVLLESAWVLRSNYGLSAGEIVDALRSLAGTVGVTVEDPAILAQALEWAETGMDLADALHLATASTCSALLTFDRRFVRVAQGRSPVAVLEP